MYNTEIKDLMGYKFIANLSATPDGTMLAYTVSVANPGKNNYKKDVYLQQLPLDKPEKVKNKDITGIYGFKDSDNLIVSLTAKEGSKTALLNVETLETTEIFATEQPTLWVKPTDEGYLVCVGVDLNRPEGGYEKGEEDYIKVEELPFWDNGRGYVSRKRAALFHVVNGEFTQVSDKYMTVNSAAYLNGEVYYTGESYEDIFWFKPGLFCYNIKTGKTTTIKAQGDGKVTKVVATEGKIIFTASDCKTFGGGEKPNFFLLDPTTKEYKLLLENDYTIGCNVATDVRLGSGDSIQATKGGIVYISTRGFCSDIYYLGVDGESRAVTDCGSSVDMLTVAGDRIYAVAMLKQRLQDIYEILPSGDPIRHTTFNLSSTKGRYIAKPKYCGFKNKSGTKIDGWVLLPPNYDKNKKYPALLSMHGGPCVAWGTIYHHEMQMFASAGYIVMFTNPRGSDGRGAEFADLRGNYGVNDYNDFMQFVDFTLKKYPTIDKEKLGVLGGSYGGYMTNWIIGNTDRFAAAVSQRSFCNPISDFGVSCIGYTFDKEQFGGTPWDNLQKLWDHAPLKYAPNCKTPTLFIHSLEDYNCPLTEGFQMYTALKYHGVETEMFLFKGENHELSRSGKPTHRIKRLEQIKLWLDKYLV